MIRNLARRGFLLVLSSLFLSSLLPAASYFPMSDADLVRTADIAVHARVLEIAARLDKDGDMERPFTVVTLRSLELFKGNVEETFQLVIPGGRVDDTIWWVPGAPAFEIGAEVVLMLHPLPDRPNEYGLTEFGLSKFDLMSDARGRRFLIRPVFEAREDLVLARNEYPLVPESAEETEEQAVATRDAESFFAALRQIADGAPLEQIAYVAPVGSLHAVHSVLRPEWANLGGVELGDCGGVPCMARWFYDTGASPSSTVFVTGSQTRLVDHYPPCGIDQTCLVQASLNNWHDIADTDIRIAGPMPTGNFEIKLDLDVAHNGTSWTTPYSCNQQGVVGIGGPMFGGTAKTFKGLTPYYACTIATVSMRRWTCDYPSDVFVDVLTHEMGHGLGLNHPDQFQSVFSTTTQAQWNAAIMFSSSHTPPTLIPQADDIQAMQFYYGTAPLGTPATASFTSASAPTPANTLTFTDTSTGGPTGWLWFFGEAASPTNFTRVQNPTHTYAAPGTYTVDLIAGNFNGGSRTTKQVTVTGGGGGGGGPLTAFLTLPSITSIHGANQTFFHSDVWVLNRSTTKSIDITLRYRCIKSFTCSATPQVVTLPPRGSRLFTDIVGSTFGSPETAGTLEIGWNDALGKITASSRLYTPSLPAPTSGFSLPGVPSTAARSSAVFIGLGGSGGDLTQGFRTNAGAYNPNASSVTVTFTLHAASGAVLGSPLAKAFGPNEPIQINDIFNAVGAKPTVATDAYLVVSTSGLPVFPYVAVIDNKSGDSVWVIPSDDVGGTPSTGLLTLPSITSIHGANQTFFHSDVWVLNRSTTKSIDVTGRYRCIKAFTCSASPQVVTLPPRGSRLFTDIVGSTFSSPETAGTLEISWNVALGEITASSRLYTPSLPAPTSGFSLPAVPSAEARAHAVFVGLGGSGGDLTQGFRTNAGAYNPNASSVTVTFTLHAASGAVLGSPLAKAFGPNEPIQINDIFNAVGAKPTVATDAYLVVSTSGPPVFPYVAVIDNKSGDSVWVIPSDDEVQ